MRCQGYLCEFFTGRGCVLTDRKTLINQTQCRADNYILSNKSSCRMQVLQENNSGRKRRREAKKDRR